jgi:ketosteroid isomerase-like protein
MKLPIALPLLAIATFNLLPIQAEPTKEQAPATTATDPEAAKARLAELDAYWAIVSKAVNTGDFETYAATCHPEGVLVSGGKQMSQPLAAALARWKQEFTDTRDGKMKASVEFRFSRRIGDATTAHETGIFLYTAQPEGGPPKAEHIHFEALLVKKPDGWKILMENQKGSATESAWQALK